MTNEKNNILIVHEDNDILVLNKPCGLIVNRSKTHNEYTVQDFILDRYGPYNNDLNNDIKYNILNDEDKRDYAEFYEKQGIIHRIDKDTSGILIIAKNPLSYIFIKNQFKNRKVIKEYIALAMGTVKENKIQINAPIKRSPKHNLKFAVVQDGKPALTYIEKISEHLIDNKKFTLLKVNPKTGRTHQIRVHLNAINHPIAGDKLYLSKINYQFTNDIFNRLMLHAKSITFVHPQKNTKTKYTTKLPNSFIIE